MWHMLIIFTRKGRGFACCSFNKIRWFDVYVLNKKRNKQVTRFIPMLSCLLSNLVLFSAFLTWVVHVNESCHFYLAMCVFYIVLYSFFILLIWFSIYLVLFLQGYLDEQFTQLEELQDETSPNFVEEVVVLFFKDSSRLLTNIEQTL